MSRVPISGCRVMPWLLALGLAGCASAPPPALDVSPGGRAADFSARSLHDEALQRFLQENTGRTAPSTGSGQAPSTGSGQAASTGSGQAGAWDFETLSWVAFYYHPSLALARAQWATARAVATTAGVRPNPTITLAPGYNTTRDPGLSPWMPSVNFDFLLPTNGKRARQIDIAQADAEAARLGVFNTVWQVRAELRRALTDAASARRRETTLRTQVTVQQRVLALLQQRFAAGAAAATEVSTIRSALLRAEAAVADAHSQAAVARARVAAALGLPVAALEGIDLPAPPAPSPMPAGALAAARAESLQSRADILAALAKFHSAQSALDLEVAKQVPDVHLGPGYQWDQGQNKWTLGVTFELPVFHRNEAPIAEAVARRAEAAAQFDLVQSQAISAIEAAVAAQEAAATQLENARQLRAEVEKQNALVRQRLEAGGADQVEVQTAQLDLATTESLIVDAETAAATAAGQLEDALQIPFPHLAALGEAAQPNSSRRHE